MAYMDGKNWDLFETIADCMDGRELAAEILRTVRTDEANSVLEYIARNWEIGLDEDEEDEE